MPNGKRGVGVRWGEESEREGGRGTKDQQEEHSMKLSHAGCRRIRKTSREGSQWRMKDIRLKEEWAPQTQPVHDLVRTMS